MKSPGNLMILRNRPLHKFKMETTTMAAVTSLPLPDGFISFLNENNIDPSIYTSPATASTPRYIRLKSGTTETDIADIESEINCKLQKVNWLPNFYSIPPHIQIASSKSYKQAKIYGIDAASGAAVMALNVLPGDHVLDLCAAPGAKLCMILELLGSSGSLTGVDIAKHRLAACQTMLQKYDLGDYCRLFVANGTSFSILPFKKCTDVLITEEATEIFKEWTPKRSWKERKANKTRNKVASFENQEPELIFYGKCSGVAGHSKGEVCRVSHTSESFDSGYDKVLVDAECTHDGSIKHIQKFEKWGWDTLQQRVLDAQRNDMLTNLQLQLLTNGFRLLKAGGSLVYSTCSLTVAQNEDVVDQFLSQNPCAELKEIDGANNWPCKSGSISKTLRFDPSTSQTSGLFIAKFTKTAA